VTRAEVLIAAVAGWILLSSVMGWAP